jgi:hypothetical protein
MSFISSGNFSTPTELAFLSINPEAGATPPDAIINSEKTSTKQSLFISFLSDHTQLQN